MQTLLVKGFGMLKAVDGSFEVPTAEALTVVFWRKPL